MRNTSREKRETMPSNKKLSILEAATRALVRSPRTTTCGESVPTMREGRGYLPEEGCLGSKYGDKLLERPNSPTESGAMPDSSTNPSSNLKEIRRAIPRGEIPAHNACNLSKNGYTTVNSYPFPGTIIRSWLDIGSAP
jgi:hypothetical protein